MVQEQQSNLNPRNLIPTILNYNQLTRIPLEKHQAVRYLHFVIHQNGSACRFSLKFCLASLAVSRTGPGFPGRHRGAVFRCCAGIWRLNGPRSDIRPCAQFHRYWSLRGAACWSFRVRSTWGVSSLV